VTTSTIPAITNDMSTMEAALAYATAGLYVGPAKRGSKHPGSVLGDGWQRQTSRDPPNDRVMVRRYRPRTLHPRRPPT
jgi:hypothetical protein